MLPSLTNLDARMRLKESVAMMVGRSSISVAHIEKKGKNINLIHTDEYVFDTGGAVSANSLAGVLQRLNASLPKRYLPVHISLAAPFVNIINLDFESLPESHDMVDQLIAWRLKSEYGYFTELFVYQRLEPTPEGHHVMVMVAKQEWNTIIDAVMHQYEIPYWSISADIFRIYNCFYEHLRSSSGALIYLNDEYWSLLIWDLNASIRNVVSHWRDEGDKHGDITCEIEKAIIAYVNSGPEREVKRIYLLVSDNNDEFETRLNEKLHEPCTRLDGADLILEIGNINTPPDLRLLTTALES